MQCSIDFIITSTVMSPFRRIRLLGSLYNAILLPCAHAQSCACHVQSCHARAYGYVTSLHSIMSLNDCASARISLDGYLILIYGLAVYFIILCCTVIAKGFMSLLAVTGVAPLCDHTPQPLCCCSLPILKCFHLKK